MRSLIRAWKTLTAFVALAGSVAIILNPTVAAGGKPSSENEPTRSQKAIATWYDVPRNSLAAERAPGELTAASDSLPLDALVRVTDEKSGTSVVVRITDRGVHRKHTIDLCHDAAAKIHLIGKGRMNVRIEVLESKSNAAESSAKK